MKENTVHSDTLYRIGTVSRLTGIATVTLRMWERRYSVVEPHRNAGQSRLYTRDDIGRLALIKRLVDEGHPIGTIAGLSLPQLQERLHFQPSETGGECCRVVVFGDALPALLGQPGSDLSGLTIVATHRDRAAFEAQLAEHKPDVIIAEYPTINEAIADEVRHFMARAGAQRAVVVYGFGRRAAIRALDRDGITPVRAPATLPELRRLCLAHHPNASPGNPSSDALQPPLPPVGDDIPTRRYSNEDLAHFAAMSTPVDCECPQHLAELLFSLTAFELYSQECENRNEDDAALHRYLYITTARARAMMEEALSQVIDAEGLDVSDPHQSSPRR
ncbi:MAG: MerR family transcriptional regulator [Candidatus Competibacterales bacterium]